MSKEELDAMTEDMGPWYKGPIKYILAIFMLLLILVWFVPIYSVKLDPHPKNIPLLADVLPGNVVVNESHRTEITMDMIDGSDAVIKAVADKIVVEACSGKGRVCHAKALFYFVRDNFEYVSDPTAYEYVKTAKQSLVSGGGDCDDASVLLANLLDAIGVRIRFVFVPGHVYLEGYLPDALNKYKVDGDMVPMDATCSYCEFGEIPYQNFDKEKTYS